MIPLEILKMVACAFSEGTEPGDQFRKMQGNRI